MWRTKRSAIPRLRANGPSKLRSESIRSSSATVHVHLQDRLSALAGDMTPRLHLRLESGIDSYEAYREALQFDIRSTARIPPEVRVNMLHEAGFSSEEIKSAVRGVKKDQERRNSSLHYRTYDLILERTERWKNGVKRMTQEGRRTHALAQVEETLSTSWSELELCLLLLLPSAIR